MIKLYPCPSTGNSGLFPKAILLAGFLSIFGLADSHAIGGDTTITYDSLNGPISDGTEIDGLAHDNWEAESGEIYPAAQNDHTSSLDTTLTKIYKTDGSEFKLVSVTFYKFGPAGTESYLIGGYRDNSKVEEASGTYTGTDTDLILDWGSVDEIRFAGSANQNFTIKTLVYNSTPAPSNTAPTITGLAGVTGDEDSAFPITYSSGYITVADADGDTLTASLAVSNGSLNVNLSGSASISAGANDSSSLSIQGSVADLNATLASLTYTGDTDYFGVDTLTYSVTDGTDTTTDDSFDIFVYNVDEPGASGTISLSGGPTNDTPQTLTIHQPISGEINTTANLKGIVLKARGLPADGQHTHVSLTPLSIEYQVDGGDTQAHNTSFQFIDSSNAAAGDVEPGDGYYFFETVLPVTSGQTLTFTAQSWTTGVLLGPSWHTSATGYFNGDIYAIDDSGNIISGLFTFIDPGPTISGPSALSAMEDSTANVLDLNSGTVTKYAGNGSGYTEGDADTAQFKQPWDLVFDDLGNLYVADGKNHRIRKITPDGQVSTFAGDGTGATLDGTGTGAQI